MNGMCPECWDGDHANCIGQSCACGCLEDAEDDTVPCPKCHGSGLEWEGWPCYFCEGMGTLDF